MSLRILHLLAGSDDSPTEQYLLALVDHLPKFANGIQMEFALCSQGELFQQLTQRKQRIHLLGDPHWKRGESVRLARKELNFLLNQGNFDGTVIHSILPLSLFAPVLEEREAPYILQLHHELSSNFRLLPMLPDWNLWLARTSEPHAILCSARFVADSVHEWFPNHPCRVIPAPFSPQTLTKQKKTSKEIILFHLATNKCGKGTETFIEVLSQLNTSIPWRAWIAKESTSSWNKRQENKIKKKILQKRLADQIQLLGFRSDTSELISQADIYCHTNLNPDPIGTRLIEAIAAGIPVVSFNTGGASEIITNATGRVVDSGDISTFAKALENTLQDSLFRQQCKKTGPARVDQLCSPQVNMALFLHEWNLRFRNVKKLAKGIL